MDYLGVPTTIVGNYGNVLYEGTYTPESRVNFVVDDVTVNILGSYQTPAISLDDAFVSLRNKLNKSISFSRVASTNNTQLCAIAIEFPEADNGSPISITLKNAYAYSVPDDTYTEGDYKYTYYSPTPRESANMAGVSFILEVSSDGILTNIYNLSNQIKTIPSFDSSKTYYIAFPTQWQKIYKKFYNDTLNGESVLISENATKDFSFYYSVARSQIVDIDETTSPYWRSNDTRGKSTIKLSAIPPRMYETIYNLYYRNPQNNPYILNGKPEYNIFIPTKDGGADTNLYELRFRNWEDDFLTTAVQSPQQGIAPLVGLTDRSATITLTNEDGSVTRYITNLDDNGNLTGIETTDTSEPLLTQALIDAVSYGISIEDLRNVNAMQKWLELNLRKGYQYKDIIEARWGISISYNELDLPEFIGGFTQEVGLQAVTQTTSHGDGIEGALGWQAGRMYAAGSGREITHYCDEEGYIMALLTVVPVPNYSQLLPKHWFTRDLLDSYQPEFNHIGFQPITYKEVCPIQAFQESTENVDVLEQTFGYQRPWYEYFNQVDEVHGQFRTTFKDFLINRTFDVKPELSESFLLVDPDQINDVFAVTTDDDKIIGAIEHRITAKLPISLYAQARLE